MAQPYTSVHKWDDDERNIYDTLKPAKIPTPKAFDFGKMLKEIAREEWKNETVDYFNSYEYEYNCELYDTGAFTFNNNLSEPEESETEECMDEEVVTTESNDEEEENEILMVVDKFMYT